jgi:hypothetical protein
VFRSGLSYAWSMHPHYTHRRGEIGAAERLVPAIVLISIGVFFLLNNLHLFFFRDIFQYWPAILVAFGLVKLVDSDDTGSRAGGGIMVVAGGILLARNMGYLDMRMRDMWPLILIGIGLWMLFQRTGPADVTLANDVDAAGPARKGTFTGNRLKEQAVFSGGKRHIVTQQFEGGKVEAVFGGYELDFTRAGMAGNSCVLHVDAVFGGVEIKIPPSWNCELRGTAVFGAFTDETLHPDPAHYPDMKHLIVKGSAVFGGVEVKN